MKQFHDIIRQKIPVASCIEAPEPGTVAALNSRMSASLSAAAK